MTVSKYETLLPTLDKLTDDQISALESMINYIVDPPKKPEPKPAEPKQREINGRYTFINEKFLPSYMKPEFAETHRASGLGYKVFALIEATRGAIESDVTGVPIDQRCIDTVLEIAMNVAGDLIDACEYLERDFRELQNSKEHL